MPIINKITEVEETELEFLEDVDVGFVSLVNHAATKAPFKIIRSAEGGTRMENVVQSICVPKGKDLKELVTEEPWLGSVAIQRKDSFDAYEKLTHRPHDLFVEDSFRVERVAGGALAMIGTLKEADEKAVVIRANDLARPIGVDAYNYVITFGDLFYQQLDSTMSIVFGALGNEELNSKKTIKMVSDALDSLKSFVTMGLSEAGEDVVVRVDASKLNFIKENTDKGDVMSDKDKTERKDGGNEETQDTADPMKEVLERLDGVIKDQLPELIDQAIVERFSKKEEVEEKDPMTVLLERVESLTTKFDESLEGIKDDVKKVVERVDSIEGEGIPESNANGSEDKETVERKTEEKDPSSFKGIFKLDL